MCEEFRPLLAAAQDGPLPIVRFELRSSREKEWLSIALNHVWMTDREDSMETVKIRAAQIRAAEEQGLIRVDFALPVTARSHYAVYLESALYADFCRMVEEGKRRPGYLFDTPYMKRGAVTLTAKGRERIGA